MWMNESMLIPLPANVHIVHVGCLLLIRSNRNRWSNRRFSDLLHLHAPFILRLLQITQPELRLPVWHSNVHTVFTEDTVYLRNHLIGIRRGIFTTLNIKYLTKTESMVALSITASKDASGKSIALASMSKYLKVSGFSLYFSFMAFTQTFEMSILVICVYPSSNISSLSRELPAPTLRIRCPLSTWVVMMSLRPLKRWYQSKGSGSLHD